MSENEKVAAMIDGLRDELQVIVKEILSETGQDLDMYGNMIAAEFSSYMWKAYRGDIEAEQNLGHLKAQALLLIAKCSIRASNRIIDWLEEAIALIARIGIKAITLAVSQ